MSDSVLTLNRFRTRCSHGKYIVDESLNTVECGLCGKELNATWVLVKMCRQEDRYRNAITELNLIAEKANKKNRCKCEKCGQITRIQR